MLFDGLAVDINLKQVSLLQGIISCSFEGIFSRLRGTVWTMSTEKKSLDVSKTEEDEDQDKVVDNVENAEGGKAKKNKKRKKKKASKEQQAEPEVKPVSCEWVSPC